MTFLFGIGGKLTLPLVFELKFNSVTFFADSNGIVISRSYVAQDDVFIACEFKAVPG